jgi:hypothetical protein
VFIARKGVEKANYHDLQQAAHNLLRRTHLISTRSGRNSLE